ncbi:uncharacterized protein LOC143349656 [Colletes latitarsis]|uniref:uncharacterized protein LOC143349656 n=1 Tax=Colletes latitarsis TaxID=2605962 RepID=UPI00403701BD
MPQTGLHKKQIFIASAKKQKKKETTPWWSKKTKTSSDERALPRKRLCYFLQLHPKTYLSAPVIIPFPPRSCGILGASTAIHRIAENGEFLSRIIPDECCWFTAQSRCGVSRITDNLVVRDTKVPFFTGHYFLSNPIILDVSFKNLNCTAFLDCSHHARDKEWFCQNNTMVHPSGMQAILRQKENCKFSNERNDGSYIVIGTTSNGSLSNLGDATDDEFDNECRNQMTLKIEESNSSKHSNVPLARPDGNVP